MYIQWMKPKVQNMVLWVTPPCLVPVFWERILPLSSWREYILPKRWQKPTRLQLRHNLENHNMNFHYHQSFKPLYKPRIFININSKTNQWKLDLTDNVKWTNTKFILYVIVPVTKSDTDVHVVNIKECHCYPLHKQFFPTFNHKVNSTCRQNNWGVFSADFNMVHIFYIHECFRKHRNTVRQDNSCS